MRRIVIALAILVSASSAFAAGPFGSIRVGAWNGGAFTNDANGSFSHCSAATGYANGISVVLGQNAQRAWLLGFASDKFQLTPNETFPIDVTFDGQSQYHLFGNALNKGFVVATLPNAALITQFRKSHLMVAVAKGATFQFELKSTGQLLPTIGMCVDKILAGGLSAATAFTYVAPKAPLPEVKTAVANSQPAAAPDKPAKTINVTGTGFVVSAEGHVVTNNHVVGDCVGEIQGSLPGESAVSLRVVSLDDTNDLALLQASRKFSDIAKIKAGPIRSGESVIAIGFPFRGLLSSDFTVTAGIISSLSGLLNDTRFLQISAPVQPGNSGGPLFDMSGSVVGVVAAKINALKFAKATGDLPENINFAIKTGAMRDFMDNSAINYQTQDGKPEMRAADIARNARAYTMLISCTAKSKE